MASVGCRDVPHVSMGPNVIDFNARKAFSSRLNGLV